MTLRDLLFTPGLIRWIAVSAGMLCFAVLLASVWALRPLRDRSLPRHLPTVPMQPLPVALRRRR